MAELITAVPTPFTQSEDFDPQLVRTLFSSLAQNPIDAAFVAGTTGEFTALSDSERLQVLEIGMEEFGPDRAFLHVGATHTRQAVSLTRSAAAFGATRLAAITPYYLQSPPDATLRYFEKVVSAAGNADVYAYLFASRTTSIFEPEQLPRLTEVGVKGVKISGESDESVMRYLECAPPSMVVYSGNDISFATFIAQGGRGVISGVSSVYPTPFLKLRDAIRAGDQAAIVTILPNIASAVESVKAGSITLLKSGLEARGLPGGPARVAEAPATSDDRRRIRAEHDKWDQ